MQSVKSGTDIFWNYDLNVILLDEWTEGNKSHMALFQEYQEIPLVFLTWGPGNMNFALGRPYLLHYRGA